MAVLEKFGVRVIGHYTKLFYERLTRRGLSANGKKKEWYINCPTPGCSNDFRLDSYLSRARKQRTCADCRYPQFEGVQLRGPIRRFAKVIVSVKRGKPHYAPFFTLACKTKGCAGTVSWPHVQRTKQRLCAECKKELGLSGNSAVFTKWRRYITRKDWGGDKKKVRRYWAECAEEGCGAEFVFHAWHGKPTTKCPLHRHLGVLFGVAVRSRVVWQLRKYMTRVEPLEGGGHKWFRRCQAPGCKKEFGFTGLRARFCRRHELGLREYERIFNQARSTARNTRNLTWTLSYAAFVALKTAPNCFYCDKAMHTSPYSRKRADGSQGSGIDRLDSTKGYHSGNCVPCCGGCNRLKGRFLHWREMAVVGLMRQGKMRAAQKHVREALAGEPGAYEPQPVTMAINGKAVEL